MEIEFDYEKTPEVELLQLKSYCLFILLKYIDF